VSEGVWSLPGPSRLASAVGHALFGGASCAVVAPAPLRGNEDWVAAACEATEVDTVQVPVFADRPPAAVVAAHFEAKWTPGPGGVSELARSDQLAGRIIAVALPPGDAAWAEFTASFLAALPAISERERPQLLVFCGPDELPAFRAQRLPLTERWWWGTISRLDTTVAAARALGERADPVLVSCITEVCGFDLGFVETLAQSWDGSLSLLIELVEQQHLVAATVREHSTLLASTKSPAPANQFRADWSRGLIDAWERFDPFLAPAALPPAERNDALRTRLWRGQLRELMPLVDEERGRLEAWIRSEPITEKNVTFPIEIGYLTKLLHGDSDLSRRTSSVRRRAATWLRDARNLLAHREVLAPGDILDGLALLDEDRRAR